MHRPTLQKPIVDETHATSAILTLALPRYSKLLQTRWLKARLTIFVIPRVWRILEAILAKATMLLVP